MRKILKQLVVRLLTLEAQAVLKKENPFIIAVTGSVGKTTAKDAIFHVLKGVAETRRSDKSFNSEIGIPLTILGLPNAWRNPLGWLTNICRGLFLIFRKYSYPKILVLEVGADHPGDIKKVVEWLTPDVAVVTRLPERPVHVEYFESPEAVRSEKAQLVRAIKASGVFIANGDDPRVRELGRLTMAKMVTFGFSDDVDMRGRQPEVAYSHDGTPLGMTTKVIWKGEEAVVQIKGVLGLQSLGAVLAALAIGAVRGLSLHDMAESFASFQTASGRMHIIEGERGAVIIDDSYNSSPSAAVAALETLRSLKGKRKIAMLGDMLELGRFSQEEHTRIGHLAASVVNELVVVGKRAEDIALGASESGLSEEHIHRFANSVEAGLWMKEHCRAGDVILAKGSQGSGENMIRMERAVKLLMAHPEHAKDLLVRQEEEWQKQYS